MMKMLNLNWIVLHHADFKDRLLLLWVQVGHDNVLMLVRCRQSISPCPVLVLTTEQSLAETLLLPTALHKAAERWCKFLLGLGIPLLS